MQLKKKKTHENIDKRLIEGELSCENISKAKKVTSGALYQRGKACIDDEVLAEIETRNKKKKTH